MTERTYNLGDCIRGGIIGAAIGVAGTVLVTTLAMTPKVDEARVFQREEGKPAVMRTYKHGNDGLLIQGAGGGNLFYDRYKPLSIYLESINDLDDRRVEEAAIKKVVGWNK